MQINKLQYNAREPSINLDDYDGNIEPTSSSYT